MFNEELSKVFMVVQTFFQLAHKETTDNSCYLLANIKTTRSPVFLFTLSNLLFVPVIYLVDVPKNNLVFALHVLWDALLFNPLHDDLQGDRQLLCY